MGITVEREFIRPNLVVLEFAWREEPLAAGAVKREEYTYEPTKEITVYGFAFELIKKGPSTKGACLGEITDPSALAHPIEFEDHWDRDGAVYRSHWVIFPPDWRPKWGPDHPMVVTMEMRNDDSSNQCDECFLELKLLIKEA